MAGEKERIDTNLATLARFEPDIALTDRDVSLTSIAISLKRIADWLDGNGPQLLINKLTDAIRDQAPRRY